jgi:hypothetical protein
VVSSGHLYQVDIKTGYCIGWCIAPVDAQQMQPAQRTNVTYSHRWKISTHEGDALSDNQMHRNQFEWFVIRSQCWKQVAHPSPMPSIVGRTCSRSFYLCLYQMYTPWDFGWNPDTHGKALLFARTRASTTCAHQLQEIADAKPFNWSLFWYIIWLIIRLWLMSPAERYQTHIANLASSARRFGLGWGRRSRLWGPDPRVGQIEAAG